MPSTINAQTTPFAAIVQEADNTGNLALQTANVTALTLDTNQNATFANVVTATTLVGSANASSLTTGTVATARLATGTANSSTFLRGDQTWTAVTQTRISGGTTGLTPDTLTSGDVTLAGTLVVANGGTGLTSPGTSGNVLTSNGTAWTSAAPTSSFIGSQGQVFTSSGTFTVPSGITAVKVTVIGGGGNGGNATGTTSSAGGGGGGGCAIEYVTGLTPGGTVTVTVGAVAGTSSFGAFCSATGGATAVNNATPGTASNGGAGGSGSGGNINISGGGGQAGSIVSGSNTLGGNGGATNNADAYINTTAVRDTGSANLLPTTVGFFGRGGFAGNVANGGAATGFGNGGGGGGTSDSTDRTGGAGTSGIVIVEW